MFNYDTKTTAVIMAPKSNVTTRQKRELSFSLLSDNDVVYENDKVKMTGRLTRTGNTSSSIPHFRLKFHAKIKKGFSPNQTINVPISFRSGNLTQLFLSSKFDKDSGINVKVVN